MTVYSSDETIPMTVDMSINPTIGGNMNYAQAANKPVINGHELAAGENSLDDIGVYSSDDVDDLLDDKADVTDIPTKTSDLTNDSGFITSETDPTVPAWAKAATKPSYTASEVGAVASNQGIANAGKFLIVGNDGTVVPVTMTAWQGGAY